MTASYALGAWRDLVIWVVDGHTPLDELKRLRSRVAEWRQQRAARKNVALTVLYPSPSTMSTEERLTVARMIDETKHDRTASATVVLADGILGALHRSILTGLSIVVPSPHPVRISADLGTAITFVLPHVERLCGPIEHGEIEAMVADLHAHILAARRGEESAAEHRGP